MFQGVMALHCVFAVEYAVALSFPTHMRCYMYVYDVLYGSNADQRTRGRRLHQ